ncbi:MAG: hypothetical protein ACI92G_003287 [Candidatus Pelagisphaera sp.]|jgi:hypothetical protein
MNRGINPLLQLGDMVIFELSETQKVVQRSPFKENNGLPYEYIVTSNSF